MSSAKSSLNTDRIFLSMQSALVEKSVFKWLFGNICEIRGFPQRVYQWAFLYVMVVN